MVEVRNPRKSIFSRPRSSTPCIVLVTSVASSGLAPPACVSTEVPAEGQSVMTTRRVDAVLAQTPRDPCHVDDALDVGSWHTCRGALAAM